ncbi:hypothetical protein CEUSTIGMA_g9760.t1 [Chlamydomonas eustigma]|uniref:Uncharacterized protein n=1 Tax=Chlamydomonas eustigma TaxID=1157962 RepID=A0A250XGX9_9CHLO|nr:hypothetical protein CEUSTIGMA_g9760.t1 [Chlamydomonas eustigma]|eukprot:GAX82331.1 hypothetical protein CEUSTIGMA_g9760.t1 [Chlamydomonas eustigma]
MHIHVCSFLYSVTAATRGGQKSCRERAQKSPIPVQEWSQRDQLASYISMDSNVANQSELCSDQSMHIISHVGAEGYVFIHFSDTHTVNVVPGSHHIIQRYGKFVPLTLAASCAYVSAVHACDEAVQTLDDAEEDATQDAARVRAAALALSAAKEEKEARYMRLTEAFKEESLLHDMFSISFADLLPSSVTGLAGEALILHCNTIQSSPKARLDGKNKVILSPSLNQICSPISNASKIALLNGWPAECPVNSLIKYIHTASMAKKVLHVRECSD